eukprot:TRINITY_DN74760_c0_g1_i1.p1 TRINITY_DN74760_c0_g1~~TRINITY_DN74760_c0_g1_i1.p1  ORF type:complete len:651 (+),score=136.12 TRINITY_DN74760_c0_g1_i1:207-1955(+)
MPPIARGPQMSTVQELSQECGSSFQSDGMSFLPAPPQGSINLGSVASMSLASGAAPPASMACKSQVWEPPASQHAFLPPTTGVTASNIGLVPLPNAATPSGLKKWFPQPEEQLEPLQTTLKGADAPSPAQASSPSHSVDALLDQVCESHGYQLARELNTGRGLPPGAVGKGAFGMVYKARRQVDGSEIAMKLSEKASSCAKLLDKEINILRLLDHPGIVRFIEAFTHGPSDWRLIAMEFVDGGDVLDSLTAEPQLYVESLVRPMMYHIACGLGHAHEHGVLHRDLKPENILVRRRDHFPKVADFGLGRQIGGTEMARTMAGTPTYMAPEVHDMRVPYEFPADVYSLGLVFTDMLEPSYCCKWYVENMSDKEKMRKKWPPGSAPPKFSKELMQLQSDMIQQAPGGRPTCHKICTELLRLAAHQPLPHPLWQETTSMPQGPPPPKALTARDAAEIAGRRGYGVGVGVLVYVDNVWHRGEVKHVSTSVCPGAVQVHFVLAGQEQAVLVCPWQFADMLRPAPRAGQAEAPFPTMVFDEQQQASPPLVPSPIHERSSTASGSDKTPSNRRVAPVVKARCKPSNCRQQ